ncbi:MAG TPA: DUF3455 domain-containing protein [Pyrinomonadaceae bacterium]|jgi:hypothetical protein
MHFIDMKNIKEKAAMLALALAVLASNAFAFPANDSRQPELPADCGSIEVPQGNKVAFHAYAIGVQIYRWNGAAWTLLAPSAKLFADAGYNGKVGIHYEGPRWESNSGSVVQAARVPGTGCTPDSSAIAWLLLKTVSTEGPGVFSKVTYIQRVATAGGLAPTAPGTIVGEEKRVPYTAEYYFYRAQGKQEEGE